MNDDVHKRLAALWLPFPPTVNNLFAHATVGGHTRRFPTKKYKLWRKEAWVRIKQEKLPRFDGPVAIRIDLTPPSSARRDVDNYSKAILDALVEARVLNDDSQVQKLLCAWDHNCTDPGAFIQIGTQLAERLPLTAAERYALIKLRRDGYRLCGTGEPNAEIRGLLGKGYIKELPGLLEGTPQGFAPVE